MILLPGRSLMLVRNVGLLMTNPAIKDKKGDEVPEGIIDAFFTVCIAIHDIIGNGEPTIGSSPNTIAILTKTLTEIFPKLKGDEVVYDLYCGAGSISLFLAQKAKFVYGFDIIVSSIENAEQNATINKIENIDFNVANLDSYFQKRKSNKYPNPDIVIVDPPRAGMHKKMAEYLPELGAKKIIYVSCNPSTQARDTQILQSHNYELNKLSVVDMFPHTPHVETVGIFEKSN